MDGQRASYAEVLVETEAPIALYKHLARYWAVPDTPLEDPGVRATLTNAYPATGAVAAVGLPVLNTLRNFVLRKIDGVDKLSFFSVNSVGEVSVLHSLFCVGESTGDFTVGNLYAICREIPATGLPVVVRLDPLLFAPNFPFVGTPRLKFANHLAGLESSVPRDFEDTAHQVADGEEDEGVRRVQSSGLAFILRATAVAALEEGLRPAVTDVICRTFKALSRNDKAFDGALDWMQASFMAQSDGTYVGQVRTRREPTEVEFPNGSLRHIALLVHLQEFFLGQYLSGRAAEDRIDDKATCLRGGGTAEQRRIGILGRRLQRHPPESQGEGPGCGSRRKSGSGV